MENRWGDDTSKEMVAGFTYGIAKCCHTEYHSILGNDFGFAWPSGAKECLELLGYHNVSLNWGYDGGLVRKSIDNGCPVFMSAIAEMWSGHAWVIDGYLDREYVSNRGTVKHSQTLVHCNWGWYGRSNGYFATGIFKTHNAEISDGFEESSIDDNYWIGFNTITYDKPETSL